MIVGVLVALSAVAGSASTTKLDNNVSLVDVGPYQVTVKDLQTAIKASPFSTQFASMDLKDQAGLRGDLLRRLVISRLLRLEAERLGMDKSTEFTREVENFRRSLLYREYMDGMRKRIELSPSDLEQIRKTVGDDQDAFEALKSTRIAKRYRAIREATLKGLIAERHVVMHEDRINEDMKPDTVLMQGDGLRISLADLTRYADAPPRPKPEWVREQLPRLGELILFSDHAAKQGIDVSERVENYRDERLPALLIEKKEKEWTSDEGALRAFYQKHPEIGHIAERRHVGMIVLPSRAEAEAVRKRIDQGESLFRLAGEMSVDPYGRSHNGDMGWLREGSGMPELEKALSKLEDNQVSDVIETPKGFYLLTILERKKGEDRPYAAIRDKVRQAVLNQKLNAYVKELQSRFKVSWNLREVAAKELEDQ
jgi:peptidyl-prolyl cis-trans isomerase C